jgi:drug/metabolite transporter (DMT)-like permease
MHDSRNLRRWIGAAVCVVAVGIIALVAPRLATRSPIAIVLLCALAVLIVKLVERRVHQWFRRWAEREAGRSMRPRGRSWRGR